MNVKKYKAKIIGTDQEIIGYLTEQREYIGGGCYSNNLSYVMIVTSFSMPNSTVMGHYQVIVDKDTIVEI